MYGVSLICVNELWNNCFQVCGITCVKIPGCEGGRYGIFTTHKQVRDL